MKWFIYLYLQNSDIGEKIIHYSSRLFIDGADAEVLQPGEIVTFINWGNLRILKINRYMETIVDLLLYNYTLIWTRFAQA